MSNLILTNCCTAHCPFCFASDYLDRKRKGEQWMSMEQFLRNVELFRSVGIRELRLLGGEPALHPLFPEFLRIGREQGLRPLVFSNGILPESALNALLEFPEDGCSVVINMNAAAGPEQIRRREVCLSALGSRALPGMTIASTDFSLRPAIDAILTHNMQKTIRLGLARPYVNGANASLHPKQYQRVGARIQRLSAETQDLGIRIDPDCGFVRCMFSADDAELEQLGIHYISNCSPILDFCPDDSVLPCFALSGFARSLREGQKMDEFYRETEDSLRRFRSVGIYRECSECPLFETEQCCGGCLAARIRRFMPAGEELA